MPDDSARWRLEAAKPFGARHIAPDCRGQNFYRVDSSFRDLLSLYMDEDWRQRIEPHFDRMGEIAGGRLDELADVADKHGPVLHPRDRFGRDEEWIEYHPSYRAMEQIAFGDFGMHAMSHRAGVLGMPERAPPLVKYGFTYLFVQGEFGLMCPISVSDTSNFIIRKYGSAALKARLLDRLLSTDFATMLKGTQFMTEKAGGSDVGALETEAESLGMGADGVERWKLHGDKWFCSHADADVAVMLARPRGAASGTRGLGLFALPRHLDDGSRNAYRIVRLKDKLGTRSMASGEIVLNGATAYLIGDVRAGFKQMMEQVNLSRLSHGVRAAAMMRRCLNEALMVARHRRAFGSTIDAFPLMRRQLMKIMLPTEQALSMAMWSAAAMGRADKGDRGAAELVRILTPVFKYRACRDNIRVASHALEVRGGVGYIEEWVNARLVRDAQIGTIWEGTSSINALDVVSRAVGKSRGHRALQEALGDMLGKATALPGQFRGTLNAAIGRAADFAERVAADPALENRSRLAAGGLYHAATAALLAAEGAALGARGGDARRLLLARLVMEHRLTAQDPFSLAMNEWEEQATDLLLSDRPVALTQAQALVA
ncbi:MAG: acyl-CoA dehydrogenase family protein [Alphaproteobacteria bacterium]|nr:acyl-CoA dehydrogenase family protein [Alphaproteobacteria bacterium]MCW5743289.1 acyl-CoA dehydrogenase family protein [Alphaproteobacteria bacterium]